jgi:hypothetical protein
VERIEERHRLLPHWRAGLSWVDKAPPIGWFTVFDHVGYRTTSGRASQVIETAAFDP